MTKTRKTRPQAQLEISHRFDPYQTANLACHMASTIHPPAARAVTQAQ